MSREIVLVLTSGALVGVGLWRMATWSNRRRFVEAPMLLAQALGGHTAVDKDGFESFLIYDQQDAVEICHEESNPELAADRITDLAHALVLHAERIRGRARREADWA